MMSICADGQTRFAPWPPYWIVGTFSSREARTHRSPSPLACMAGMDKSCFASNNKQHPCALFVPVPARSVAQRSNALKDELVRPQVWS